MQAVCCINQREQSTSLCGGHGFDPCSRKIPHVVDQLSPGTAIPECTLQSPCFATREAPTVRSPHGNERAAPTLRNSGKSPRSNEDPAQTKK